MTGVPRGGKLGRSALLGRLLSAAREPAPTQSKHLPVSISSSGDRDAAAALAARDPRLLRRAEPMLEAARMGRADVVALLLELGVDVDIWDRTELRGLQAAVMGGSLDVVRLLVEHGASIDRPTKHYGGAMGFAAHFRRRDVAAFLAPM